MNVDEEFRRVLFLLFLFPYDGLGRTKSISVGTSYEARAMI